MSVAFLLSWYFRPYYGYMEWMDMQQEQHSSNSCSRSSAPSGFNFDTQYTDTPLPPPSFLPSFLPTCEQQVTISINTSTCLFNWVWSSFLLFVCFGVQFLLRSQSGDDPQEDLAKFSQFRIRNLNRYFPMIMGLSLQMYPNCKTFYMYHFFSLSCVSLWCWPKEKRKKKMMMMKKKKFFLIMFSSQLYVVPCVIHDHHHSAAKKKKRRLPLNVL